MTPAHQELVIRIHIMYHHVQDVKMFYWWIRVSVYFQKKEKGTDGLCAYQCSKMSKKKERKKKYNLIDFFHSGGIVAGLSGGRLHIGRDFRDDDVLLIDPETQFDHAVDAGGVGQRVLQ